MKRLIINAACLVLLTGIFSSCSKTLEKDYMNPEKITNGSLGKLFGGMFLNKRIHASYFDYRTMLIPTMGGFSGLYPIYTEGTSFYSPNTGYTDDLWADFYAGSTVNGDAPDYNYNGAGVMSSYREMQTTMASMDSIAKREGQLFMTLAKIMVYDRAAQLVDVFGDIPFSEAGSMNTDRVIVHAKFDEAAALYDTMITDLDRINTSLATDTIPTAIGGDLRNADLYFGGDLAKWRRYANSLRLRLLMRISDVSEAKAQPLVTAMLSDANAYPLIEANTDNVLLKQSPSALKSDLTSAFSENIGNAPKYLLEDVMVANNDPRTEILFDQSSTNGFKGVAFDNSNDNWTTRDYYATYDSALFYYNWNLPGIVFTAAEVSFLKAEAAAKWSVGDVNATYDAGVTQSVQFWRSLYTSITLNPSAEGRNVKANDAMPTDGDIATYLTGANVSMATATTEVEKLQRIYTQKWVNFFIPQAGQAWAETRRTGYPEINFVTAGSAVAPTPPTRFMYPSNERLYNTNFSMVASKDTRYTKIFWAK